MYVGMRSFYPICVFRGARPLPCCLPMRRLAAVLPLSLLLVPAAAHGAVVQTDRTCYLQTDKTNVTVSGNGFAPDRPYSVSLELGSRGTGRFETLSAIPIDDFIASL